jgi:branched-chain amino acid transport system ATP-binding protein
MEALRVDHLSKSFGGLQVLLDISFSVENGERLAIIGPNGAGKTTLLNVINGQLSSDEGSIHLFGRNITTMPIHRRTHLGLARSFQLNALFFNLTVIDNVLIAFQGTKPSRFQMFRSKMANESLLVKAQELLEYINLWQKKDVLVQNLSHGEQRQMEIGLALASRPTLLLLDEPTSGLAIGEAKGFIKMISELAGNTTVVFCAHDMDTVFTLANQIMVIYFGRILVQGTPKEIQLDPRVREVYLGIEEDEVSA